MSGRPGQSVDLGLRVLPIRRPQIRSRLELAWNPAAAASPAAWVLIEHTRDYVRRLAENRDPAV